jgi:sphingosine-1-phosphate phosphatase 1
VRLQKKWALEYGMPSTHAMVGVSIPLSVILYTMNRYQVSLKYCTLIFDTITLLLHISKCMCVCCSIL